MVAKGLISPREAIKAAIDGIKTYDLERNQLIAIAMRSGSVNDPLLIKRLDLPEQAYYLVPWSKGERISLIVEVDAVSGLMRSATPIPELAIHHFLSQEEALEAVSRKFPGSTFGKPQMVWRPCRESSSPLYPFYEIPFDNATLFVDMKETIFTSLTPFEMGG
jgi:hypothetical protein